MSPDDLGLGFLDAVGNEGSDGTNARAHKGVTGWKRRREADEGGRRTVSEHEATALGKGRRGGHL